MYLIKLPRFPRRPVTTFLPFFVCVCVDAPLDPLISATSDHWQVPKSSNSVGQHSSMRKSTASRPNLAVRAAARKGATAATQPVQSGSDSSDTSDSMPMPPNSIRKHPVIAKSAPRSHLIAKVARKRPSPVQSGSDLSSDSRPLTADNQNDGMLKTIISYSRFTFPDTCLSDLQIQTWTPPSKAEPIVVSACSAAVRGLIDCDQTRGAVRFQSPEAQGKCNLTLQAIQTARVPLCAQRRFDIGHNSLNLLDLLKMPIK